MTVRVADWVTVPAVTVICTVVETDTGDVWMANVPEVAPAGTTQSATAATAGLLLVTVTASPAGPAALVK